MTPGRTVAVHATTDEGMRRAIAAGVDTIEHGYGGTNGNLPRHADNAASCCARRSRPMMQSRAIRDGTAASRLPPSSKPDARASLRRARQA